MATPAMPWRRSGSGVAPAGCVPRDAVAPRRGISWAAAPRRPGVPRLLRRASRIEAWPPALWLALQALALWPVLAWAARRFVDGSDEPLGLLALALLGAGVASGRLACQWAARRPWLIAAALLTLAATAAIGVLPWLALALLAALALGCAWAAFRQPGTAVLPVLGLLVLALPLLASLQFYAGFPLRWLSAHGSAALLQLVGLPSEVSGTSVTIGGVLVIVDAPCSGVRLAWFGYFIACTAAWLRGVPDRMFVRRLPAVSLAVLGGNIVRNAVLIAAAGGALPPPIATALNDSVLGHEAVGLAVLAAVGAIVLWLLPGRIHAPR